MPYHHSNNSLSQHGSKHFHKMVGLTDKHTSLRRFMNGKTCSLGISPLFSAHSHTHTHHKFPQGKTFFEEMPATLLETDDFVLGQLGICHACDSNGSQTKLIHQTYTNQTLKKQEKSYLLYFLMYYIQNQDLLTGHWSTMQTVSRHLDPVFPNFLPRREEQGSNNPYLP